MLKDNDGEPRYFRRRIREMVETLEAGGTRKIMSNEDGMLYLVGSNEMALFAARGPVALEHPTSPRLSKLGGYPRTNCANVFPA